MNEPDLCPSCWEEQCVCEEEELPTGVTREGRTLTYSEEYWEAWLAEFNARLIAPEPDKGVYDVPF